MIQMKILDVGTRTLRYIRVNKNTLQKDCQDCQSTEGAIPVVLFFGSDVLSRTTMSMKNRSRNHFVRSKSRQCCKVTFPSKLHGVTGHAQEAWFYDVKGLMSVAFESYTFEEQRSVIKCLFSEWSNSGNVILPSFVSLSVQDLVQAELTPTVIVDSKKSPTEISCELCKNEKMKREFSRLNRQRDACFQTVSPKMESEASQCAQYTKTATVACQTDQRGPIYSDNLSAKDECHNPLKRKTLDKDHILATTRFLNAITTIMKDYYNAASSNIFFFKIYVLFETFLFLIQDERQIIEATTTGIFPFHLMCEYANFKKQYKPQKSELPANVYFQDVVLQVYSKWLGTQYHKFQNVITTQTEEYKKTLISQNKFLPSSVELLTESELYPPCMIEFLNLWLHGGVQKEEKRFECSQILLVLELMNDNLITGVGHVVYAKLKSSDSV